MSPLSTPGFAERYAAFLISAHADFETATIRLPRPWDFKSRASTKKPWRPVIDAALSCSAEPDGLVLEFGVFKGDSIRHMATRRPKASLHGFDSFQGFPEDARRDWEQDFSVTSLPEVPDNVSLHQGFFDQTLPPFVAAWNGARPPLALIHIDCDIFSSTHTVLTTLEPYLRAGDILVFDELMNYTEFAMNEFLALYLFLERTGLDFDWLATWGRAYPLAETEGRMLDVAFDGYRAAGYFQNQSIRLKPRTSGGHFDGYVPPQALVERIRTGMVGVPAF